MKIQFPSFRAAAEFFSNPYVSYDTACERVREGIKYGYIVIAPTKTDWSLLGEWLFFTVGIFLCVFMFAAMCAWAQIETCSPQWMWIVLALTLAIAWLCSAIHSTYLMLVATVREI